MSFADSSALQANIANWLARDDLAPYIPDFIVLFEAAAARRLKVRLQETTISLTPSGGAATLPSDYLGYRRVTWTGSPGRELEYVAPTIWSSEWPAEGGVAIAGIPVIFTIEGPFIKLKPSDDTPLTFTYFQRTPALSAGLNWLYTNYPDAYLFGSLAEANAFNKAVDAAGLWKGRRDEVFDEIFKVDFNERQGMAIRVYGHTP